MVRERKCPAGKPEAQRSEARAQRSPGSVCCQRHAGLRSSVAGPAACRGMRRTTRRRYNARSMFRSALATFLLLLMPSVYPIATSGAADLRVMPEPCPEFGREPTVLQ